jgi:nitrite reductase/ring-hydroxylating ferredoxin subunit
LSEFNSHGEIAAADPACLVANFAGAALLATPQLGDPDARSVVLGAADARLDVIIVRAGGVIYGYLNSCPHRGTPLETFDGRILDTENPDILVCSTHGARFRLVDGVCVNGPCLGSALRMLALSVDPDWIRLAD